MRWATRSCTLPEYLISPSSHAAPPAKRARVVRDVSAEFLKELLAQPISLRSLDELRAELEKEIPGPIVVPLPAPPLDSSVLPFTLGTAGEIVDLPVKLTQLLLYPYGSPAAEGTEEDIASFACLMTGQIWKVADQLTDALMLRSARNTTDPSGTTVKGKRPDYCLWVKGALLLKAEHKRSDDALPAAIRELVEKMNGWNMVALRGLPFLPCYAVGGKYLQFCAITPPVTGGSTPQVHTITEAFNMAEPQRRLRIMRVSLNMLRVFAALRKLLPPEVPQLYAMQPRTVGYIIIMDTHVRKVCVPAPDAVYACLGWGPDAAQLPCAVTVARYKKRRDGLVALDIQPVCMQSLPDTEADLRDAIRSICRAMAAFHSRGFAHRDLRWPNCLRDVSGRWCVADFELADKAEKALPPDAIADAFLPPEILLDRAAAYGTAGDMYRIGRLCVEWSVNKRSPLSAGAQQLVDRLTSPNPSLRPSADSLLKEAGCWLNFVHTQNTGSAASAGVDAAAGAGAGAGVP